MDKQQLLNVIIGHLELQLDEAVTAATNARNDAVNDESVAETQYDTIAIEAGYLAEGQSRRVEEFHTSIKAFRLLKQQVKSFSEECAINIGALVQLQQDESSNHWFFIAPNAGGFKTKIHEKNITLITPKSPMGQALIGKFVDDEIKLVLGSRVINDVILAVY